AEPDVPAPTRLLQEYDNSLRAHADRSRVISVPFRPAIFASSLLLDGFVAATWKIVRLPGRARLVIESFKPMRVADREMVGEEGCGSSPSPRPTRPITPSSSSEP